MRCTDQRPYASATGASAQIGGLGEVGLRNGTIEVRHTDLSTRYRYRVVV